MPDEALKKASERLLRYVQERHLIEVNYSDNANHSRFAVQAYAGYVLARSQQAPLGALRSLYERRSDALVRLAAWCTWPWPCRKWVISRVRMSC